MKTQWQPANTAPGDGTIILADFGWPWPVCAAWNTHDFKWNCCVLNAQGMANGTTDIWFENEQEDAKQLKKWMPLPKL